MNTRSSKLSLAAILDTSIGRLHVLATVIMTVHLQPPMEFAVPYAGFTDDFNKWMAHKDGSALAALVDLLVKSSRGAIDQVEASARLCPELAQMAGRAVAELSSDSADPDDKQLLRRIQQTDRDLMWEPIGAEFRWAPQGLTTTAPVSI